jgi:hypothetical protein
MSKLSALTASEAAHLYGVSARTIYSAKKAIRTGSSALAAALETGKISVNGAAWLADYADASVQNWVVAKPHRGEIRQRLRLARYEPEAASRAARKRGIGEEVPRAIVIPVMGKIAVSAARATTRV